jgi:hypothetical protein
MNDDFFRRLTPDEEISFRQWARENWHVGDEVSDLWHPVVRDEITKIAAEVTP